jgi:hypothetical protein
MKMTMKHAKDLAAAQKRMRRRNTHAPQFSSVSGETPIEQDRHFTTQEIADMRGLSVWSVRRIFQGVPLP